MRICEASSLAPSRDWDISSSDRDGGGDTALERRDRKLTQDVQSNSLSCNTFSKLHYAIVC